MHRLTRRAAVAYDRLRATLDFQHSLRFDQATSTGYVELSGSPITSGWYCEYQQDDVTGEQFLQVLVAEDAWDTAMMDSVAALVIEKKRHKVTVKLPPVGAPAVWLLRATPTGESIS